jgi:hypothetical protein
MSNNKNIKKAQKTADTITNNIKETGKVNSGLAEDAKQKINQTLDHNINQVSEKAYTNATLAKNMIKNLAGNLNNSFVNNTNLSQKCLKCTTAGDLVDIQRNFFECNFNNTIKIYSDFMQDLQKINSYIYSRQS